jgi:hypothetical protein
MAFFGDEYPYMSSMSDEEKLRYIQKKRYNTLWWCGVGACLFALVGMILAAIILGDTHDIERKVNRLGEQNEEIIAQNALIIELVTVPPLLLRNVRDAHGNGIGPVFGAYQASLDEELKMEPCASTDAADRTVGCATNDLYDTVIVGARRSVGFNYGSTSIGNRTIPEEDEVHLNALCDHRCAALAAASA